MTILTGMDVLEATTRGGVRELTAADRKSGRRVRVAAEAVIVAAGRGPTSGFLHPEKGGVQTDGKGWIKVDEYLQTTQPGVWAMGDADGRFLFKHVANYESEVVYYNAVLGRKVKADYHAVPHAVFTYPEAAGVGMKEAEAVRAYGKDGIVIGFYRYEDTAKGEAMAASKCFVKVIMEKETERILGAHVAGPYASMLIQELVNAMYTGDQGPKDLRRSMYVHPALNEVVQRALYSVFGVDEYHQMLLHGGSYALGHDEEEVGCLLHASVRHRDRQGVVPRGYGRAHRDPHPEAVGGRCFGDRRDARDDRDGARDRLVVLGVRGVHPHR